MSRALAVRAVLALAVIAGAALVALTRDPRLGLDLRGGTQIVLQTQATDTVRTGRDTTDRAVEVLRHRVDALGVAEPSLTRSGDDRILVELPGLTNAADAAEVIGKTAQLSIHPVLGLAEEGAAQPGARVLPDESGQPLRLGPVALAGDQVTDAAAGLDERSGTAWLVTVDFSGSGRTAWRELTAKAACAPEGDPTRRIAIVLDDKIITSPQVDSSVACDQGMSGGGTQITGRFTGDEAKDLAALVKGGALPVPVEIVEQRTVGPTLGADAIDASWRAALLGLALTAAFVVVVYRLVGLLATVALCVYALVSYAALVALGATLTLPGLAGFVLAIGMAVDANVLTFERAREEYAQAPRRGLRAALINGFKGSWSAILDSNVTTVLAAGLLLALAAGPVRGFGVTLVIGVVASMFSALVVTRALAEWAVGAGAVRRRPLLSGLGSLGRVRPALLRRSPDLVASTLRRRVALGVTALLIVTSVVGIALRGLQLGVEFTGGRLVEYSTSRTVDIDAARAAVTDAGFPRAIVQESDRGVTVRVAALDNAQEERVASELAQVGGQVEKLRDELVGPSLGEELQRKALVALAVALGAQLAYLALRFRWTYALAAVLAMLHDVVLVVGLFAWLGRPVDGVFLAALLTVIGYSVNDTVVVFDRVRSAWRALRGKRAYADVANAAVLQTLPRTVNTGAGVLFVLVALAVLGGDSLTDFAIALLTGVLVGTWSSAFTATPLAVELERRWPAPGPVVRPAVRTREGTGAVV